MDQKRKIISDAATARVYLLSFVFVSCPLPHGGRRRHGRRGGKGEALDLAPLAWKRCFAKVKTQPAPREATVTLPWLDAYLHNLSTSFRIELARNPTLHTWRLKQQHLP
eukprot:6205666-Amphidinium_carterae.1